MSGKSSSPVGVPLIHVRGGTTSSRHDRQQHEARQAAERGRRQKAKQEAAVARSGMTKEGFVSARLHSLRMMDRGAPQLVLYYMNHDKSVKQECVSEIFVEADGDTGFTMVCPKCLERGVAHGLSQMRIMNAHRKFHIDPRRAGEMVELIDPYGKPFHVRICGTVTCDDVIRCDQCNMFAVRIEGSRVWEV